MANYLAIVAYRGLVSGVPTGNLDIQVQWFDVQSEDVVRSAIQADPIQSYKNSEDETVSWELVEVFSIEPYSPTRSGEEVIGFIASTSELNDLVW